MRLEKGGRKIRITHGMRRQRQRLTREALRVFQSTFQYEPGDRIEVVRHHFTAKPHCLERNGAAACKGIQHAWSATAMCSADLLTKPAHIRQVFLAPPEQPAVTRAAVMGSTRL